MHLTKNFTLAEMFTTKQGIPNYLPAKDAPECYVNLVRMTMYLQVFRDYLQHLPKVEKYLAVNDLKECPIYITSGFRSERLNKLVGGKPTSRHLFGLAVDCYCPAFTAKEFENVAYNFFKGRETSIFEDQICLRMGYSYCINDTCIHIQFDKLLIQLTMANEEKLSAVLKILLAVATAVVTIIEKILSSQE